jgi:hypothetical protein
LGEGRVGEEIRKGEMGKLRGSGKWVRRSGKVEKEKRKGERSTLLRKTRLGWRFFTYKVHTHFAV